jgi:HD-GYP domain-containing protein (c-di-GMP phosphodiesterase class II)
MRFIRRYNIRYIKPGMELANPVMLASGAIVATEKTVLTESLIRRLLSLGLNYVDIYETRETTVTREAAEMQRRVIAKHGEIANAVKEMFQKARYFKTVSMEQMDELAKGSIQSLVDTPGVLNHLQMIQDKDKYTFNHSVNVAVICGIIGKWQHDNMSELVMAGLLHDVGKTQVPLEILNKPGKLADAETQIMQKHPLEGLNLCKHDRRVTNGILAGIVQHHERMDGSGYPFGLAADRISKFGRIVAVADMYDAMTSNRVYRRAMTPLSVLKELFADMFGKLDPATCTLFINNLKETLTGYIVLLSDGTEARVIHIDRSRHVKPMVETADGRCINLEGTDLEIVEVISS